MYSVWTAKPQNDAEQSTAGADRQDFDLAVFFLRNVGRLLSVVIYASAYGARQCDELANFGYSREPRPQQTGPDTGPWLAFTAVYGHGYRLEQIHLPATSQVRAANMGISTPVT
jgi:hypothetical protein